MAQGGRFEDSRGRGVATYRAGKQTGGDLLAKLGFMGRVQTVCCRIVTLHRVQSSYSVLAFSPSLKLQINWTLHNYTPITAECVGLNSPKTVVRDGPFNEKYNYSNRFSVSSAFIKETSAEF